MKLSGKKVVVIGGTSGIGFACAEAALAEGAHVVVASRSDKKCSDAKQKLGVGADALPVDITSEPQVASFFKDVDSFDHLVLTAASNLAWGRFSELNLELLQATFDTKFF